jgi:hypothetical protein
MNIPRIRPSTVIKEVCALTYPLAEEIDGEKVVHLAIL